MYQEWDPPRGRSAQSLDEIHVALSHRQRRFVVYELSQAETLALDELANRLHEWNRIADHERTRSDVLVSLERTHLPVLEHAGIVEYDADRDRISLEPTGERAEEIRRLAITQAQK